MNSNGLVVWSGSDGLDDEIFFYDGTSVQQITDNSYPDISPVINENGDTAWRAMPEGGTDYEIMVDTGNGPIQFTDNAVDDSRVRMNSARQLLWEQDNETTGTTLMFYDGFGTVPLAEGASSFRAPFNESGQAVWRVRADNFDDFEIVFFDGVSNQTLTDNSYQDQLDVLRNLLPALGDGPGRHL